MREVKKRGGKAVFRQYLSLVQTVKCKFPLRQYSLIARLPDNGTADAESPAPVYHGRLRSQFLSPVRPLQEPEGTVHRYMTAAVVSRQQAWQA